MAGKMSTNSRWDRLDGPRSWLVALGCFMAHVMVNGLAFTVGIYYVIFLDEFRGSTGATSLVGSLNFGMLCMTGPISSLISHRWSCRVSVLIGGLLSSLGLILSSFATGVVHLMLTFGLLTGLGFGLVFTPAVTVVSEHFDKQRSLAMGITMSGVGFGGFIYPFILDYLIVGYGWRGSLLLVGAISLNLCVCGALMFPVSTPLKDLNFNSTMSLMDQTKSQLQRFCELVRNLRYNILVLNTFLMCFGMSVFTTHMPAFSVVVVGLDEYKMSTLLSAMGISGVISRILLGLVMMHPRVNIQILFVICYTLEGMSTICIPLVKNYEALLFLSALFGSSMAAFGPVLSEMAWLYTTTDLFPLAYGCLLSIAGLGSVLGAPVAGILYEKVQAYPPSFYLGGGAIVLSAAVIIVAMQLGQSRADRIEEEFEGILKSTPHLMITPKEAEAEKLIMQSIVSSV